MTAEHLGGVSWNVDIVSPEWDGVQWMYERESYSRHIFICYAMSWLPNVIGSNGLRSMRVPTPRTAPRWWWASPKRHANVIAPSTENRVGSHGAWWFPRTVVQNIIRVSKTTAHLPRQRSEAALATSHIAPRVSRTLGQTAQAHATSPRLQKVRILPPASTCPKPALRLLTVPFIRVPVFDFEHGVLGPDSTQREAASEQSAPVAPCQGTSQPSPQLCCRAPLQHP